MKLVPEIKFTYFSKIFFFDCQKKCIIKFRGWVIFSMHWPTTARTRPSHWLFANFLWCPLIPVNPLISSPVEWAWHLVFFPHLPTPEVNPHSIVVLSTWYRPNAVPPLNNWTFYPAVSLSVNMSWQHNIQFVIYSVLYFPLTALNYHSIYPS